MFNPKGSRCESGTRSEKPRSSYICGLWDGGMKLNDSIYNSLNTSASSCLPCFMILIYFVALLAGRYSEIKMKNKHEPSTRDPCAHLCT